jgi:hypothetical protein
LSPKRQAGDPFSKNIIDKMRDENFFGQASIDLSEVEKRLKNAEHLIGNKEEISRFIESGIHKFGCKETHNSDGTFNLEIKDNRLLKNNISSLIKKYTYDPLRGINEPELEVIDLGHPIVQNMISLVKEQAFTKDSNYCRTACVCVNSIEKITVMYTLLIRHVAKTKPISIVEELAFVGVDLYGSAIIEDDEFLNQLRNDRRLPIRKSVEEMRHDLALALSKDYDTILNVKAQKRCNRLIADRKQLKDEFGDSNKTNWVNGIDELSVASVDLLCVTIYYPSR